MMVSVLDGEDGYEWEMNESLDDEFATGVVLHWPVCATQYIEGRMIETDLDVRTGDG